MSAPHQTSIVLYVMKALKANGSWCGETHVQKTLFMCQELFGVRSDFKFILYKHGPYSFQLSEHLQGLIADDLIHVRSRPPYGPSLELSEDVSALYRAVASELTGDLLDRLALDEVLAPYPGNCLHDQHPRPPASLQSRQRNRPTCRGSILDADPPA